MANEKRLIDANALIDSLEKWLSDAEVLCNAHVYNAVEDCINEVDTMPTVDAVEVVRCKDCKHNELLGNWMFCKHPEGFNDRINPDGYCSYGERKGDGNA